MVTRRGFMKVLGTVAAALGLGKAAEAATTPAIKPINGIAPDATGEVRLERPGAVYRLTTSCYPGDHFGVNAVFRQATPEDSPVVPGVPVRWVEIPLVYMVVAEKTPVGWHAHIAHYVRDHAKPGNVCQLTAAPIPFKTAQATSEAASQAMLAAKHTPPIRPRIDVNPEFAGKLSEMLAKHRGPNRNGDIFLPFPTAWSDLTPVRETCSGWLDIEFVATETNGGKREVFDQILAESNHIVLTPEHFLFSDNGRVIHAASGAFPFPERVTPLEMTERAGSMALDLLALPSDQRLTALQHLRKQNAVFYALVKAELKRYRNLA